MIDALIALLRLRRATDYSIAPLRKFAEKLGKTQRRRNRIVHDPWLFKPSGEAMRSELSANREVISTVVPHSTQEVEAFSDAIIALASELEIVLKAVCSATIWMGTQRQSGWPFRRSRREYDCRGATITQAIFA